MTKVLVLVIDDDNPLADALGRMVSSMAKYTGMVVYSAAQALETIRNFKTAKGNRIGCLLVDIRMADMDGFQLIEMLRKEFGNIMPAIIISAYEDPDKWKRAVELKVADYLVKPFSKAELEHALDQALDPSITDEERLALLQRKAQERLDSTE